MNLSRVVVIVAVTAAIVYAGLNYLLPKGQKTPAADVATAAEAPPSTDATTAPDATAEPAESEETMVAAASDVSADDSSTGATAEDPALTDEEARRIAANVAAEVANLSDGASEAPAAAAESDTAFLDTAAAAQEAAPETMPEASPEEAFDSAAEAPVETAPSTEPEPAAVADIGASTLTEEQARRIAANIAAESGGVAEEPALAAAPAPKPAPAPRKAVAETAAEPEPAASAPRAPKPVSTASGSAPKPVRKDPPNAAPTGKTGNGADVISAWWKKPGSTSNGLNLVYAGEASSEKAVVLMFDDAVDASAAGSQIKLIDAKGGTPSGSWSSGSNPRLIAFKGVAAGRYTVIVGAGMTSAGGKSVGSELVGPVYVH